jgi:hypothetical protein
MAWHGLSIFSIIETVGAGSVVRIVYLAPLEFPLHASVDVYNGWPRLLVDCYMRISPTLRTTNKLSGHCIFIVIE